MFRAFRVISAGFLVLASVFLAFQMAGQEANLSTRAIGAAGIELAERHGDNQSRDPLSGHHGATCSATACASIAMAPAGSSFGRSSSPNSPGIVPDDYLPQGITVARDPPVPRLGSS